MKKSLLSLLLLSSFLIGNGQKAHRPNPYKIAFGAGYNPNLKDPYTVNLKFYNYQGYSFEFMGYNLQESWRIAAFFEPYTPISSDGKFRLVIGPGLHVGLWKDRYKNNSYETNPIIGIDGIMGFEYRIPRTPINLQIHWNPNFDFVGNNDFHYESDWAGAVIRIAF